VDIGIVDDLPLINDEASSLTEFYSNVQRRERTTSENQTMFYSESMLQLYAVSHLRERPLQKLEPSFRRGVNNNSGQLMGLDPETLQELWVACSINSQEKKRGLAAFEFFHCPLDDVSSLEVSRRPCRGRQEADCTYATE
jgi:hypothetical protein